MKTVDKNKVRILLETATLHLDAGRELLAEGLGDVDEILESLDASYEGIEKLSEYLLQPRKGKAKPRYYFAYGANLNKKNMAYRCPTAKPVGPAVLQGYRLAFKGVADVLPVKGQHTHGAVWIIKPGDEESLDQFEGYPYLYTKRVVDVKLRSGETMECMIYLMNGGHDRSRRLSAPSAEYYRTVARGYRDFNLPFKHLIIAVNRTGVRQ